jgi:hypothetical protein
MSNEDPERIRLVANHGSLPSRAKPHCVERLMQVSGIEVSAEVRNYVQAIFGGFLAPAAWPIAAVTIAMILREPIKQVMGRATKITRDGVELAPLSDQKPPPDAVLGKIETVHNEDPKLELGEPTRGQDGVFASTPWLENIRKQDPTLEIWEKPISDYIDYLKKENNIEGLVPILVAILV